VVLVVIRGQESDMAQRCFPMDKPDYERITELVKRYHRKDHVTTAWWEEEMWGSKHRGRVVLVTRPATAEDYAEARYQRRRRHHQTAAVQCPGEARHERH
jgi:hypothetical protein